MTIQRRQRKLAEITQDDFLTEMNSTNPVEEIKTTQPIQQEESKEYIKNLDDQKTVNVNEAIKHDVEEEITIDFLKEDFATSYTSSSSKDSTSDPNETKKSQFEGKSVDDLRSEVKTAEAHTGKEFTPQEFEEIARFIIFLIDTSFSTGMKMWAKDVSDEPYSLPKAKQETLVYQLTLILVKYQAKFSIEFMFIITVLVLYIPGILKARKHRKEINARPKTVVQQTEKIVKKEKPIEPEIIATPFTDSMMQEIVQEQAIMEQNDEIVTPVNTGPKVFKTKGKPGRKRKL